MEGWSSWLDAYTFPSAQSGFCNATMLFWLRRRQGVRLLLVLLLTGWNVPNGKQSLCWLGPSSSLLAGCSAWRIETFISPAPLSAQTAAASKAEQRRRLGTAAWLAVTPEATSGTLLPA